ncbi:trypsin-like peptidase domain-containing protein [Streptomyces lushanensis]|uniref:trypsin-like peptidase domain-containing protein n=1 Tax=Streptomyces lushanensis TaxID=1434255 RepID=UPI00082BA835|nr:trypsin-like peptidase domain-containing protein [Streptomyces lushanensis]
MSTENEGTAAPGGPSVPPVPDAAPQGTPPSGPPSGPRESWQEPTAQTDPRTGSQGGAGGAYEDGQHRGAQPGGDAQPGAGGYPGSGAQPGAGAQPGHPDGASGGAQGGNVQGGDPAGGPKGASETGHAADAGWPPPPPVIPSYAAYGGGGDGSMGGGGGGPQWGAPEPGQEPRPTRRRQGGLITAVLAAALIAGGIGGGVGYWASERNDDGGAGSTTVAAADAPKDVKRESGTVAAVAQKSLPSVVTIEAQGGNGEGGTGTGFVYDKQGHILTNNHVVASAANGGDLTATFSNGDKYDAEVVGRAEGYDVAVVKLKKAPPGLTPLPLANSDQVAVGDSTIAIGAPFGLSNTVTTGIISAKNRPVASGDGSGASNSYMSALQTDASINPGNSGGPLLDARGAVIGINSAIQSAGSGGLGQSQAGSIGLGFAIPINQAKNVAEQLIETGQPVYPLIGATVTMTEGGEGATISPQGEGGVPAVTPNGPAAKAGLKAGDVITKFNDTPIDSGPTLIGQIWTHKPGDKVTLTYIRDGKESKVQVTLGERKGES